MGGVAILARQLGFEVTGSDANVYPPMSTQLEAQGITLTTGYDPSQFEAQPDLVVIGNALSRGNPCVEYVLNKGLAYTSGPQFVSEYVLKHRWVLAVAGTHGKTTTTSLLAWILDYAGLRPGFLVGGVPENFGVSARLGDPPFFVIEADEYDTAFFDKRSKFVHYHPRTAILNNLEFDHADIFEDLNAIKKQFNHFVRIVPQTGLIITPKQDHNLADVLAKGCWTPVEQFDAQRNDGWSFELRNADGSEFEVFFGEISYGVVSWSLIGLHNCQNGLAAIAAARHAGVTTSIAIEALRHFVNIKRRMEVRGIVNDITVYDDFAHHPTAIATTVDALRRRVAKQRIVAVLEPRSNTMRMGVHKELLPESLAAADNVVFYQPNNMGWDVQPIAAQLGEKASVFFTVDEILRFLAKSLKSGDHVLIMSNGGFENIHSRLLETLKQHGV